MANRNRKTKKENRVKNTVAASDKVNDRLPQQKITEKAQASPLDIRVINNLIRQFCV